MLRDQRATWQMATWPNEKRPPSSAAAWVRAWTGSGEGGGVVAKARAPESKWDVGSGKCGMRSGNAKAGRFKGRTQRSQRTTQRSQRGEAGSGEYGMGNVKAGTFRCECGEWTVEVEWKTKSCAQDPLLVGGDRERAGGRRRRAQLMKRRWSPRRKWGQYGLWTGECQEICLVYGRIVQVVGGH